MWILQSNYSPGSYSRKCVFYLHCWAVSWCECVNGVCGLDSSCWSVCCCVRITGMEPHNPAHDNNVLPIMSPPHSITLKQKDILICEPDQDYCIMNQIKMFWLVNQILCKCGIWRKNHLGVYCYVMWLWTKMHAMKQEELLVSVNEKKGMFDDPTASISVFIAKLYI